MKRPRSLQEAIVYFSDPENCHQYMVPKRFPDGVTCPSCGRKDVVYLANQRKWQCKSIHPKRQFTIKVGTIFEDSPLGLDKWLPALWMVCNCRNGVSSYEIHRALRVTQKTAWFMLHRIRLALKNGSIMKMGGSGSEVEVDETFVGGKARNMHADRRLKMHQLRNEKHPKEVNVPITFYGKTPVMGMLDRESRKVRATVVRNVKRETLQIEILENVEHGSSVYTDKAVVYDALAQKYVHEVVDHMKEYVNGRVHTNGLENFWSLLKRGLSGTYVAVEPFHLFRYVDEQVFRYNNRKDGQRTISDAERFEIALSQIAGKRLTYADATGKVGAAETF